LEEFALKKFALHRSSQTPLAGAGVERRKKRKKERGEKETRN